MAFRPTIAVIINDEIGDIGYYRNWDVEDLFIESLGLAVTYQGCRSLEEFRDKAFGKQKIYYIVEPESFENTQDNLRFFEECSEFPICVDLTRGAIYCGYCGISDEVFNEIPEALDIWPKGRGEKFYWKLLEDHKISFDKLDMECIRDLFLNDSGLRAHLSSKTNEALLKAFTERSGDLYDEAGSYN